MIQENLVKQVQEAMKAGDELRVSTLRLLSNALHNEEIDKRRELTGEEELAVVRRQIKQREEAVEALRQAQSKLTSSSEADLKVRIGQETKEAEILKEFLPPVMSEQEVTQVVDEVISQVGQQAGFGGIMGQVMGRVGGKADGKLVAEIVKSKLGSGKSGVGG